MSDQPYSKPCNVCGAVLVVCVANFKPKTGQLQQKRKLQGKPTRFKATCRRCDEAKPRNLLRKLERQLRIEGLIPEHGEQLRTEFKKWPNIVQDRVGAGT